MSDRNPLPILTSLGDGFQVVADESGRFLLAGAPRAAHVASVGDNTVDVTICFEVGVPDDKRPAYSTYSEPAQWKPCCNRNQPPNLNKKGDER